MFLVKLLQLIFGSGQSADPSLANAQGTQENGAPNSPDVMTEPPAVVEKPKQPFVIILSRMIGDMQEGDASVTARLTQTLAARAGVELQVVNQAPVALPLGDDLLNLGSVLKTCWGWLDRAGADVVVWGELEDHSLRLRFVPRDSGGDGVPQTLSFADSLIIPSDINESIGELIYGAAVASIMPRGKRQAKEQKSHLAGISAAYDNFIIHPIGLEPAQVVRTKLVGAAIALRQARQDDNMDVVRRIAETLRAITEDMDRESKPVAWMLAHRHLGDALLALAEKNSAIPGLDEAAEAYTVVTQDPAAAQVLPVEWAEAKVRLGQIMHKLAVGKPELSLLRDSVAAYNESLTVFTKFAFPNRWAEVQNSLGKVLTTYGENTSNVEALDQAAKLFANVLTVRSREGSPSLWAATQNNIGAVRFSYGKQKQDIPALREAAESFRMALEIYEGAGAASTVQVITNNLLRVERLIGTWEVNAPKASDTVDKQAG